MTKQVPFPRRPIRIVLFLAFFVISVGLGFTWHSGASYWAFFRSCGGARTASLWQGPQCPRRPSVAGSCLPMALGIGCGMR